MTKRLLIDALHPEEMRVAIADDRHILDYDFVSAAKKQVKGNIYLAKITRVEPSLQAAFVEYGGGKQGFLPFGEIHPDYYQIPVSDRKRLLEEAEGDELSEPEAAPSSSSGVEATLGDAPAEHGPGYDAPLNEDSASEADAASETELPTFEAIPEQGLGEETPAAMPAERGISFSTSEVVAQDTVEHEQLAEQLAGPKEQKEEAAEGVETLASDEEAVASQRKRHSFSRRYKIQEVIKRGQIVLVQVIKEERGNKGVSLTTFLSLAGRYCVLMPNSPRDGGVSRKINDSDTRRRLKEMMSELKLARGMSVIIRTAGIDRTRAEILRDFDYLVKLWNKIRETTLVSTAPALIYEESDLIKRAIRDLYTNDIEEVVVEGDEAYASARDFMKMLLPSHTPRVKHYAESLPLFYAYNIEDQLLSMHDPVVKLRSGGYVVMTPTEALISIDVNSGRSTSERNIEETATKTNLEAANEIARQLRLRDLAGLIVIDFIDMMESRNRRAVERALKDALKNDRAKIQLGRISPFGLLEMSRQRLRPSIAEANMVPCQHCLGRGHLRSNESLSIQIVRSLEKEAANGNWQAFRLSVPEHVALHLLNTRRTLLTQIEQRYGVQVNVVIDHSLSAAAFTIERTRRSTNPRPMRESRPVEPEAMAEAPLPEEEIISEEAEASPSSTSEEQPRDGRGNRRRGRRGGRGRRRGGRPDQAAPQDADSNEPAMMEEPAMQEPELVNAAETEEPRPERGRRSRNDRGERGNRSERGERGERPEGRGPRRRWRGRDEENSAEAPAALSHNAQPKADSESLPSFTRSNVVEPITPRAPSAPVQQPQQAVSSTHRPDGQPPRKGWWQKIIELE